MYPTIKDGIIIFPIKMILWSDGFAPALFNDSSVHICLATIGAKEGDHTGWRTFPV